MALAPSTRLGPYEIIAPLGAGGMGEVYRARDPRMGREVAIKVSAERFSDRFDLEVRAVAALNHSNICQIYDVGPNYLVMELVEGTTLAERIQQGAIPLEEALGIAHQIGDALEAAHDKGIIHRDLKPANIKLKPDGGVKVLDFGLAKVAEQAAAAGSAEESPTVAMGGTITGQIMGTAAYMAPEQARGKTVDKRVDIWAFGVVLYEMLTGRRMFDGETISDVLAGVLTREPDLTRVPIKARRLLLCCLQKEPKRRLRDIADAWDLLDEAQPLSRGRGSARLSWATAGAATIVAIIALWAPWRKPADRPLMRLDVDLGPDVSLGSFAGANAILSPDGTRLVYVSGSRLFARRLDQLQATELPGTEGADAPFFSPDGQWVAYFTQGMLKKVPVEGGATVVLCNAPNGMGGSWGEDGTITAALNVIGGLSRVPANGGAPSPLTELDSARGEFTHRWPQVLPGGNAVLFTSHTRQVGGFDDASIVVMSLRSRRTKTLLRGGTYARYLRSGHLVHLNRATLFAAPFDLDALELRGTPAAIVNQVAYSDVSGGARFEVSQSGALVYEIGGAQRRAVRLEWLESDGKTRALALKPGDYGRPSVSPDGQRVAVDIANGSGEDVWVYDWRRDAMTRLTSDGKLNQFPIWSPDSRYIVFEDAGGLSWTRADGAGKPQPLLRTKGGPMPWSFAPDGKRLAYFELGAATAFHLWTVPIEKDDRGLRAGQPEVFLQTSADERHPSFSPDGRWLAYSSTESGGFQVYVRAFPDKGGKWQISTAGGVYPTWSRTQRELFFESPDNQIMVAGYAVQGDSFMADKPRLWSETRLANLGLFKNYDLAPDGRRIAALMPAEGADAHQPRNHVVFLMNFFDEVRRRVGQGK